MKKILKVYLDNNKLDLDNQLFKKCIHSHIFIECILWEGCRSWAYSDELNKWNPCFISLWSIGGGRQQCIS